MASWQFLCYMHTVAPPTQRPADCGSPAALACLSANRQVARLTANPWAVSPAGLQGTTCCRHEGQRTKHDSIAPQTVPKIQVHPAACGPTTGRRRWRRTRRRRRASSTTTTPGGGGARGSWTCTGCTPPRPSPPWAPTCGVRSRIRGGSKPRVVPLGHGHAEQKLMSSCMPRLAGAYSADDTAEQTI